MQVKHGLLVSYVSGFEALALQPLAYPIAGLAGVHEGIGVPVLFENAESGNQLAHKFLQATTGC